MTLLLAGISGPAEAATALEHGADIIDVTPTADGGSAVDIVRATVRAVAGRRPVSAGICQPLARAQDLLAAATALVRTGVDYLRIELPASEAALAGIAALAELAARVRLVAVLRADRAPDPGVSPLLAIPPILAAAGFYGVMLDTADVADTRLLDHLPIADLGRFVAAAHAAQLRAWLAGGLEPPDVPRLLVLRPDLLGVRLARRAAGAAAADPAIDPAMLGGIRALMAREAAPESSPADLAPAADYRLLATRGPAEPEFGAGTDRVFVSDLVLPVRIGAYAFEYAAPQRVRFDVVALVARPARPARDMADVFSYDLIVDAIRLLVDGGHHALVESLAERIAGVILAHRRVVKVTVRVTKLDVGSGEMGVEIERLRQTAQPAADILPLALRPGCR